MILPYQNIHLYNINIYSTYIYISTQKKLPRITNPNNGTISCWNSSFLGDIVPFQGTCQFSGVYMVLAVVSTASTFIWQALAVIIIWTTLSMEMDFRMISSQSAWPCRSPNQTEEMLWSLWFKPPSPPSFWGFDDLKMEHLLKGRSLGVRNYVRSSVQELRLELSAVNKKCHRSNKAATKKCKLDQISSPNFFRKKSKFKKHLVISGCTKKITLPDSKNGASLLLQSKRFMTGGVVDEICSIPRFSRCKIWVFHEMLFINFPFWGWINGPFEG